MSEILFVLKLFWVDTMKPSDNLAKVQIAKDWHTIDA